MANNVDSSLAKKRFTGPLLYVLVLGVALAVVVGVIELARRTRPAAGVATPTNVTSDAAAQPFPREVRDALGETLVIPSKPNRIVSQTLGTDEILLNICEPERIVALSNLVEAPNYSNVVEQAKAVAGRTTEGVEQILQFKPDLVFVASYSVAETVELLKASRVAVIRIANFESIADIKTNIRMVGYATGCDAEAENLVRRMDEELAAVQARIPRNATPLRVMYFGRTGNTAGAKTLVDDLFRAAGAINATTEHGITGFAKISVEKIAEWQPDVIVLGGNRDETENVRRQLLADPVIATSRAGRGGRIIVIDNRHFLTVSQYVVRAVEDLANGLYANGSQQ